MLKTSKEKGITIISLIITIIVLLILSGVVINNLINGGLFDKISMSKIETDKSKALEELKLLILDLQTEKKGSVTLQYIVNKLEDEYEIYLDSDGSTTVSIIPDGTKEIYIIYKGYKFRIDDKLQITIIDEPELTLDYDTVLEKINSKEEFSKLIENKNNINAIISDINTYKELIINNKNAMECIGYNKYAGNKMIQNTQWREAILSSQYLDDFNKGATTVPIMTSTTTPEGEVIISYLGDAPQPYKCFNGDDTDEGAIGRPNTLNGYIGYIFTKEVMPYYVSILNYPDYDNYLSNIKIQGLDEKGTWVDLTKVTNIATSGWSHIELKSNEAYGKYTGLRVLQTTDKGKLYYAGAYTIQFYCRSVIE